MAKQMIVDLQPNEVVSSFFAISERNLIPYKNKSGSYLHVLLSDRTGSIVGRAWDNAEEIAEICAPNRVVRIEGHVEEYRGQLQIIIEQAMPCQPGEYELSDFLEGPSRDPDKLLAELYGFISQINNPYLRQLVESFFTDEAFVDAFVQCPGAKRLHHSHIGGLLEHTVSVVKLLCAVQELHPQLNRDLLIAGGLLHDIGKIAEFHIGPTIEYTDVGRLVGHIVITDRWLREKMQQIPNFPAELDYKLSHLILSHHGQKEYGAPIVPMTAEACALHYADNLDAHVQYFVQEIAKGGAAGNSWTEYQKLFDRYLYIGSPVQQEVSAEEEATDELSE